MPGYGTNMNRPKAGACAPKKGKYHERNIYPPVIPNLAANDSGCRTGSKNSEKKREESHQELLAALAVGYFVTPMLLDWFRPFGKAERQKSNAQRYRI